MSTEVLRPQDCLVDRICLQPKSFHNRRKGNGNGNTTNTKCSSASVRKSAVRFEKKVENGRSETGLTKKTPIRDNVKKNRNNNNSSNKNGLINGQVMILKRGENLDTKIKAGSRNLVVSGTERIGPDPDLFSKQFKIVDLRSVSVSVSSPVVSKRVDTYAGSAVSISPSPNSLPLPSFFSKKQVSKIFEDSATRDLCRLLRLE
ncbi:uncharacterized protein LOC124939444 [Impatiens glandulifera]|uniref:uncharacterized protein LOC124939444 n=1 Tax=Impatiens glandulifera TaxID=253017 RepID=UPI001FB0A6C9|nr:uncharacterized protein LOC124939444 [Impatiens glandulifera]